MFKKKALIASALLATLLASSQDTGTVTNTGKDQVLKNKKGYDILPEKGDIGLGFNTIPILDLLLGAVNPSTPYTGAGNIVRYTANSNNQIVGKYYLDNKIAIRLRFGVNTLGGTITNQVQDAYAMYKASLGTQDDINAASLIKVDDKLTFVKNNVMLSVGFEKRRGYRRLQGFYGAEIGFGKQGSSEKVNYGNAFSDIHPVEFTNNFNFLTTSTQNPLTTRIERTTSAKNTGDFRLGLRGFIGIEYFIFTKISIAAEYGWGYSVATRRKSTSEREVYNNGQNGPAVINEKVDVGSKEVTRGFSINNNNGSAFSLNNTLGGNTALSGGAGALTIIFHF